MLNPNIPKEALYFESLGALYEPIRDRNNSVSIGQREANNTVLHFHDCFEFYYVTRGWVDLLYDGGAITMHKGQMAAIAGLVPHGYRTGRAEKLMLFIPRTRVAAAETLLSGKSFRNVVIDDAGGQLLSMMRQIQSIADGSGCYAVLSRQEREELLLHAADLFLHLMVSVCGVREKSGSTLMVFRAFEYISQNFRSEIRIDELAAKLYCCQNTLSTQFKRVFGITMNEYLSRIRALEARRILQADPKISHEEAAERAGFGSLRTFYRVYKKEFGTSPADDCE